MPVGPSSLATSLVVVALLTVQLSTAAAPRGGRQGLGKQQGGAADHEGEDARSPQLLEQKRNAPDQERSVAEESERSTCHARLSQMGGPPRAWFAARGWRYTPPHALR